VKTLNLLNIRIDGGTQARLQLNQEVVAEYAEKMRDGEVFPPVTVYFDGSEYWLADGFHRYFATKANAKTSIDADVENGTQQEAKKYSWKANTRRGLRLNHDDYRNIILAMLQDIEAKEWSNRKIAEWVGVTHTTVNKIKNSLEADSSEPKEKKYINKHGKESVMKTEKIGKTVQKIPAPDMTSALMVKQEVVFELNEKIDELSQTINMLADENTLMRDKIAIGQWDASEIEKIDAEETIKDLREQLRVLDLDNKALRQSRDMFQSRNSELMKTVKSLQSKLKKLDQGN
jgi:ParB-like chromosome segregation protein Spo0J